MARSQKLCMSPIQHLLVLGTHHYAGAGTTPATIVPVIIAGVVFVVAIVVAIIVRLYSSIVWVLVDALLLLSSSGNGINHECLVIVIFVIFLC